MVSLDDYRRGRIDQARLIAGNALDTLFKSEMNLTMNLLKANLLMQCKFGKHGEALKSPLSLKQKSVLLQAVSYILHFKDDIFAKDQWKWEEQESEEFVLFLSYSRETMDRLSAVLIDEKRVIQADQIMKQASFPILNEEISMPISADKLNPELVLLSWLRCILFIWIESKK